MGAPKTTSLRILEVLKKHEKSGISVKALAEESGTTPKLAKQLVFRLRMCGHVIGSHRDENYVTIYMLGKAEKLAPAANNGRPPPAREVVYAALQKAGDDGMSGADIQKHCPTYHTMKMCMQELKAQGRVFGHVWPGGGSWRYYLSQEALDKAYALAKAAFRPKQKEKKPKQPKAPKPLVLAKSAPKKKTVGPQGEATNPNNVKPVIGPGGKVERFAPDKVEPFFGAMTPGTYADGDTWASRVYG